MVLVAAVSYGWLR